MAALAGQLVELSRHKFASNVMEKCIQFCAKEDRAAMVDEVLATNADGSDVLLSMMTDQFSNYVVQRLLDFCDDEQKARLAHDDESAPRARTLTPRALCRAQQLKLIPRMRMHLNTVKKFAFGKHIAAAVEKMSALHAVELAALAAASPPTAPATPLPSVNASSPA